MLLADFDNFLLKGRKVSGCKEGLHSVDDGVIFGNQVDEGSIFKLRWWSPMRRVSRSMPSRVMPNDEDILRIDLQML